MGAYLNQTGGSITEAEGDLTDDITNSLLAQLCPDGSGGILAASVARVIRKAEGRINVALAPLYSTPLDPVPEVIASIALDFAVYYAYERKPEFASRDGKNPARERFADAKEQLKLFKEANPPLMDQPTRASPALHGGLVESDTRRGWDDVQGIVDDYTESGSF